MAQYPDQHGGVGMLDRSTHLGTRPSEFAGQEHVEKPASLAKPAWRAIPLDFGVDVLDPNRAQLVLQRRHNPSGE